MPLDTDERAEREGRAGMYAVVVPFQICKQLTCEGEVALRLLFPSSYPGVDL